MRRASVSAEQLTPICIRLCPFAHSSWWQCSYPASVHRLRSKRPPRNDGGQFIVVVVRVTIRTYSESPPVRCARRRPASSIARSCAFVASASATTSRSVASTVVRRSFVPAASAITSRSVASAASRRARSSAAGPRSAEQVAQRAQRTQSTRAASREIILALVAEVNSRRCAPPRVSIS